MTTYRRVRRSNPPPLWAFVAVPASIFALLFVINLFNRDFQENSRTLTEISQNSAKAEMESAFAEAEQVRAITRYESGICVKAPSPLEVGQHFPGLTRNSQLCTVDGVTATLDGTLHTIDLARTNNIEVIRTWRGW